MYPDTAKKVADVLVEDLKHFMHPASKRQKHPVLVAWDEFQAADPQDIQGILSQGRQFNCGVILATQDINKLGDELAQKVLTSDTTTFISFRTQQSAEFVAKLAGTVERPLLTRHLVAGQLGDEGSVRPEPKWRVDPNDIAKLPDGYAYIVRQRTFCKVHFNVAEVPDDVPPEPVYLPVPIVVRQPIAKPKVKEH